MTGGPAALTTAPAWSLILGACTASLSVLLLLGSTDVLHVAGWALGSIVTIFLIALYRLGDRRASASPWYSPRVGRDRAAVAVLVIGFGSAFIHAYAVAHGASV